MVSALLFIAIYLGYHDRSLAYCRLGRGFLIDCDLKRSPACNQQRKERIDD